MTDLKKRQKQIQDIKKWNDYKTFLQEITSRYPLMIYKNKWLLSLYPETERSCPVISTKEFEDTRENFTSNGLEYNFDKWFFDNFSDLYKKTPFPALYDYSWVENGEYSFAAYASKNCYLSFTVITNCENIFYSFTVKENCKNVFNSSQVRNNSENIYQSLWVINSFNIFYSRFINNCSNIHFSTNLIWCHDCLWCNWLENASYCISNKQYTKQEYLQKKDELLKQKNNFPKYFQKLTTQWQNNWSQNCSWSFVQNSHNLENANHALEIKDWKNLLMVWWSKLNENMYDVFEAWAHGNNDFYGVLNAGVKSEHLYNSEWIVTCSNIYYYRFLENCSFCIWCIWLKNKQFCILNTQYSKEERLEIADKIFIQMDNDNILWKYFPASLNPFYFNDSIASLVGDFTKQEVESEWYLRRDEEIKVDIPEWTETVKSSELDQYQWFDSEWNRTIDPSILKKVIIDEKWNFYRIVKLEYDFLIKHGLPLPEIHWLDRIKLGFKSK